MKKVFIALPTYNEAQNIRETLDRIYLAFKNIKNWELGILVIDDNSPDGTAEIVKELQVHHKSLHLLSGPKHGLGAAYIRGMSHIIKNFDPDYIMEMDADLQHNPDDIIRFLDKADKGYEFIIGSRYINKDTDTKFGLNRKIYSWGANFIARYIAGIYNIKDCTSGFRCISAKFLKNIELNKLQAKGYAFQMDLLHAAHRASGKSGLRIIEIPIQFPDRLRGTSKLGPKDVSEFFVNALKLRLKKYS